MLLVLTEGCWRGTPCKSPTRRRSRPSRERATDVELHDDEDDDDDGAAPVEAVAQLTVRTPNDSSDSRRSEGDEERPSLGALTPSLGALTPSPPSPAISATAGGKLGETLRMTLMSQNAPATAVEVGAASAGAATAEAMVVEADRQRVSDAEEEEEEAKLGGQLGDDVRYAMRAGVPIILAHEHERHRGGHSSFGMLLEEVCASLKSVISPRMALRDRPHTARARGRAVSCRAVPCRAVPCRVVPCRAVSCRVVPSESSHATRTHALTTARSPPHRCPPTSTRRGSST
jgi:hypothetical protein